jgi:hypothetical protein
VFCATTRLRFALALLSVLAAVTSVTGAAPGFRMQAARLELPPLIDGKLDEEAWDTAASVSGFLQVQPSHGEPSPLATTVLLGYDDQAVYVAFRCGDDAMQSIAASVTARDGNFGNDDVVVVMFDTFDDGSSGYYFGTNSLGTQFDGTLANNGRTVDDQWDAAWENASAPSDTGWTVEFRIPFEVLRYTPGEDRIWGVNFQRIYPRRLETSVWAGPVESEWRVSEFGSLTALNPPTRSGKWWELIPYVLGALEEGGETDEQMGGDARLRFRRDLFADLTINPDFALIEADVERINLTRFELFIPEKRPFFLEGNERFQQRIRQFYSRRIEDISWGAKTTGNIAKVDFIALATQSELTISGTEPGTERTIDADYGVLRLQKAVMKSGNVGLLAASRRAEGDNAGSVGLDTTMFFTKRVGMTAQYMQSHGPTGDDGAAWFVRPAYDSNAMHFHIRYTNLHEGILEDINAVGFLRDDNRREYDTNLTRSWWFEQSAVEKLRAGVNYNRYYGQDGTLRSYETDLSVNLDFTNRWFLQLDYEDEFKRFEQDYHNDMASLVFGYDNRAGRGFALEVAEGKNFGDDLWLYAGELSYKISDAWNVSYVVTRLDLDPDLEDRTTLIHVLRTTYYFNNDLYLKLFAQSNTRIDKENVHALMVWRILPPFGSLQVAYQRGTSEFGERSTQGDTLFTKLAWVF